MNEKMLKEVEEAIDDFRVAMLGQAIEVKAVVVEHHSFNILRLWGDSSFEKGKWVLRVAGMEIINENDTRSRS